jgi:Domain of unknown function (DUF4136)
MHPASSRIVVPALVTALLLMLHVGLEGVDVRVEHDKMFDFTSVRTWAWHPEHASNVIVARTQQDDAEEMKRKADPWIQDAVATEMMRRGLQPATAQPDLTLTYYLLLSTNMSTQTVGQFLPATTAWGVPPFAPATQSMKMMNQGSLVLDLSAKGVVVWRGVAQAKVSFEIDDKKREALVREGVRDLLKRYPPKR